MVNTQDSLIDVPISRISRKFSHRKLIIKRTNLMLKIVDAHLLKCILCVERTKECKNNKIDFEISLIDEVIQLFPV